MVVEVTNASPLVYLGSIGCNRQAINVTLCSPTISTTNLESIEKSYKFKDISEMIAIDFMDCRDNCVPNNVTPTFLEYIYRNNGKLCWSELPSYEKRGNKYGVAFLPADKVQENMASDLKGFDYEYVANFRSDILANVLGISQKTVQSLQTNAVDELGEIILKTEGYIEKLVDALIESNTSVKNAVGDMYDWEESCAYVIMYGGVKYYYWFTY